MISFVLGGHDLRNLRNEQIYNVVSYKMHENYDPLDFPNDIAIIKIAGPIRFGVYVQPACLPKKNKIIPIGTQCFTTGNCFRIYLILKPENVLQTSYL